MALGCTVRELLHGIESKELAEWQAYYNLEPWGEERADLRAGIVASTIANVFRGKGSPPKKPKDFMPDFKGTGLVSRVKEAFSRF